MEFRKFIIVLSITITIIVGLMCGVSYGWYAYANAETNIEGTTLKDIPTVIFTSPKSFLRSAVCFDQPLDHFVSSDSPQAASISFLTMLICPRSFALYSGFPSASRPVISRLRHPCSRTIFLLSG